MRTNEEILARYLDRSEDVLGWASGDLLAMLPYEVAKPHLKEDVTEARWAEVQKPNTREAILAQLKNYMPFAWGKANDMRGLSANRSIDHMRNWVWLLGDEFPDHIEYEHYGKEILIALCEKYGLDWKQWDNGVRINGD